MASDRYLDLLKQGFMRSAFKSPCKPKQQPKQLPMVACNGCRNWHRQGKHTANATERAANLAGEKLTRRIVDLTHNRSI
jgi:hypothetical protein